MTEESDAGKKKISLAETGTQCFLDTSTTEQTTEQVNGGSGVISTNIRNNKDVEQLQHGQMHAHS